MKSLLLLPVVGALLLVSACASAPEQYVLHATTEGGDATVEYTLDGVGTMIELADGDEWSLDYDTPDAPFEISVTITALSSNEEQTVGCGINDAAALQEDDAERSASNAIGPAGSSITCGLDH